MDKKMMTPAELTALGFGFFDSPTDEQIAQARARKAAELEASRQHQAEYAASDEAAARKAAVMAKDPGDIAGLTH